MTTPHGQKNLPLCRNYIKGNMINCLISMTVFKCDILELKERNTPCQWPIPEFDRSQWIRWGTILDKIFQIFWWNHRINYWMYFVLFSVKYDHHSPNCTYSYQEEVEVGGVLNCVCINGVKTCSQTHRDGRD